MCLASETGDMFNFLQFQREVPWAGEMSVADYKAQCCVLEVPHSLYADRFTGFSLGRSLWDGMHVLFHQGCVSDFSGTIAVELASDQSFSVP